MQNNLNITAADNRSEILTWLSPLEPTYNITKFEQPALRTWATGFCTQKNFEAGEMAMAKVNRKRQLYFVPAI